MDVRCSFVERKIEYKEYSPWCLHFSNLAFVGHTAQTSWDRILHLDRCLKYRGVAINITG